MNKFINLHFNSEYSFFESPTKIKDYVENAKKLNLEYLVLTDHNNLYGAAEFKKYCDLYEIKPIFGIDLDVEDFRLILIAKNNLGFDEIKKLAFIKSKNKNISIDLIDQNNLIIINHPTFGNKNPKSLTKTIPNLYFYNVNDDSSNIFVNDNRIINPEQEEALFFINKLKEIELNEFNSYLFSFDYENIDEKLKNKTFEIIKNINVVFEKENMLPNICDDPQNQIKELIKVNIKKEKFNNLKKYSKEKIESRLSYELNVISKMGVENYFLIISDLINWAKNNKILIGPGRGSVSGSLVAYLLDITEINPFDYDLYFERFLNEERITMPDIDIDIEDEKREEVIDYLRNKYGKNNVAQICTFQRMGAKQSLKDVARYLNINFSEINELSKLISGNETLETSYQNNVKFRARIESSELFTKLFNLATMIESLPRQTGLHAAGVVISKEPVINSVPIFEIDNNIATQFSMEFLEDWNLLKIDLLGLRTLTIIKKIEIEIKKNFDPNFSINSIPLDDEKTNKLLSSAKVSGIFQLESPGMIKTIQNVKIDNFFDLVDIISLFRPGPLSNIPTYIENKNNPEKIPKINKAYDDVVFKTKGIIIYQEQIMEIVQKVANLSFAQADILRRSISKKKLNEMEQMEQIFLSGAQRNNFDLTIAKEIFENIKKFAEYGFNKSHAVAYATISYKMAYLKTRFPICFYSSIISLTASMDTVNKYVNEAKELGFVVESPMINNVSHDLTHDKKRTMILPLTFIKGFGAAGIEKLIIEFNQGKFKNFFDFVIRAKKIHLGDSVIELLINSSALREFGNQNTLNQNLEKALNYSTIALYKDKETEEILIDKTIKQPVLEICEQDLNLEAKNEIKYLGMIYNAFITSKYESEDKLNNLNVGIQYNIVIFVNKKKSMMNKFHKMSYILEISDSTSNEVVFFNDSNKELFDEFEEQSIYNVDILKLDKNGKKYWKISKCKKIK